MADAENDLHAIVEGVKAQLEEAKARAEAQVREMQARNQRLAARVALLESTLNQHTALLDALRDELAKDGASYKAVRRCIESYFAGVRRLGNALPAPST